MTTLTLKKNQAALIFEVSHEGEVSVDASFPEDPDNAGDLAAAVCTVVGKKLTEDEEFQAEVMDEI